MFLGSPNGYELKPRLAIWVLETSRADRVMQTDMHTDDYDGLDKQLYS